MPNAHPCRYYSFIKRFILTLENSHCFVSLFLKPKRLLMVRFECLQFFEWWMVGSEDFKRIAHPTVLGVTPYLVSSSPSSPWMVGDLLHNRGMAEQKTHTLTIMCSPTSFCQRGTDIYNLDPITPAKLVSQRDGVCNNNSTQFAPI